VHALDRGRDDSRRTGIDDQRVHEKALAVCCHIELRDTRRMDCSLERADGISLTTNSRFETVTDAAISVRSGAR
jgi:hypothetical protein